MRKKQTEIYQFIKIRKITGIACPMWCVCPYGDVETQKCHIKDKGEINKEKKEACEESWDSLRWFFNEQFHKVKNKL